MQECSFDIEQGRITCLVGPNGAGKTTIFNAITGFLRPDEGHVTFRGRSLDGLRPQAIVHAGIARTFQNLRLFTDLSALDNVMVALPRQFAEEPLGAIFRPLHAARSQTQRREEALRILGACRARRSRARDGAQPVLWRAKAADRGARFWRPARNCCCWTNRRPACRPARWTR